MLRATLAARNAYNARAVLGLGSGSLDHKDVKKAYLELAKQHHPDAEEGDPVKFREVKEAYEKLRQDKGGGGGSGSKQGKQHGSMMDEMRKWYKEKGWWEKPKAEEKKKKRRQKQYKPPKEGAGLCGVCGKLMSVPVRMVGAACGCNTAYCMTCVRDALGLNGVVAQHRVPRRLSPCPKCAVSSYYPPTERSYVVDTLLAEALDEKFGPIQCHRCPTWTGPRTELATHLRKCGRCPKCNEPVRHVHLPYHKCGKPLKICRK